MTPRSGDKTSAYIWRESVIMLYRIWKKIEKFHWGSGTFALSKTYPLRSPDVPATITRCYVRGS